MSDVIGQNQDLGITQERGERVAMHPRLHEAARKGNLCLLEELINPKAEDNGQPGETTITVAPQARQKCNNVSISGVTHSGDTALHIAAYYGHLEVARWICRENRLLLKQVNEKEETPLHYAAQAGNSELVGLFIEQAEVEGGQDAMTMLLQKTNNDGETALYKAIQHCKVIDDGELRPDWKFTPLQIHIGNARNTLSDADDEMNVHVRVVKVLVDADLDLANSPNTQTHTSPLYLAIMQNSPSIVTHLLRSSQAAYEGPDGRTALHAAALKYKGFVEKVLQWGRDQRISLTHKTDSLGSTPLHYATSVNNLEAVKLLLEADKASAYIHDSSGLYPIHLAAKMGFWELMPEFFKHCLDADELLDPEGRNFLHLAVVGKKLNVVRWVCCRSDLVKAMNSQDKNGDTPMHLAVKAQDVNIFALLLGTKSVNICIVNKDGMKPGDLAYANTTVASKNWQNPNYVIHRTLYWIGSSYGIHRRDHFISKHIMLTDQNMREEMAKDKDLQNIAKSTAIGATLIASAAFAGAFTITVDHSVHGLSLAFKAFVLMASYSFLCSITATGLVVEGALGYMDSSYRKRYLFLCSFLVRDSIKGFIITFALGVLIVLIQVSQWRLAALVCLTCCTIPVLLQPHFWPDVVLQRALIRYLGIRKYVLVGGHSFFRNIGFGIIVPLVLFAVRSRNTDLAEQIVLTTIIAILLFISYPSIPFYRTTTIRTDYITVSVDHRLSLVILFTFVAYLLLFPPFDRHGELFNKGSKPPN